ncbi:hypothetical protein PUN28_004886 [Cardiocondyla obscurior]|uniref:Uncharacterized protein n=1 Tax=Cardiocondyla obscurior TaxID=286306 RepID=A0AAW2GIY2_9HYME
MHDPAVAGSGKFYPRLELFSPFIVFRYTPRRLNERSTSSLTNSPAFFLACCVQATSIAENRPREKCLTSTYGRSHFVSKFARRTRSFYYRVLNAASSESLKKTRRISEEFFGHVEREITASVFCIYLKFFISFRNEVAWPNYVRKRNSNSTSLL